MQLCVQGLILEDNGYRTAEGALYFRASREKRFGMKLEAVSADRDSKVEVFRQRLAPLRTLLPRRGLPALPREPRPIAESCSRALPCAAQPFA